MQKILFSHSYFLRYDPKQWATGQPYAPLGTLYAAAVMRQDRHKVKLFDSMFSKNPDEVIAHLEEFKPSILVLYDDGFNYLTKMCLTNMREAAFKMIGHAKNKGITVIVSSSDSTDHFEKYLSQGADFIIIGEGEQTLRELVKEIDCSRREFSNIAGIAYKTNDAVVKTMNRPVLKDLDSLPFPAWDLVDIEPYRKMWLKHTGYFSMNMATTRGCPFKCNWCAKPIYGNRYNSRTPANVVKELKLMHEKFRYDHIWFCDDIFGLKPGWVNEFSKLIQESGIKLKFKIQARADLLLEQNYIADLASAGCANIWMGAESGSQKILDAMDKGTTVDQIYRATGLLKKNGINPSFFIQFGYPGETKDDISKTIEMITKLLPYEIGISVSYPLPGTVFFERVKSELKEKSNWTDSDELSLMFKNTYKPEFYKQLHRYVHKTYRKHIATDNIRKILRQPSAVSTLSIKKSLSFLYYAPSAWINKRLLKSLETNS